MPHSETVSTQDNLEGLPQSQQGDFETYSNQTHLTAGIANSVLSSQTSNISTTNIPSLLQNISLLQTFDQAPLNTANNSNPNINNNTNISFTPDFTNQPKIIPMSNSPDKSNTFTTLNANQICPYGCCNTANIPDYLFLNGLIKGNHHDVVIKAFGKKYKLHKLFLDRSPYFKSLFSWSSETAWSNNLDSDSDLDSTKEFENNDNYRKIYNLPFEEDQILNNKISPESKQKSFELSISRLYGAINLKEEYKIPYNMIEMGQYLAINEVVCTATEYIIKNMNMSNLAENLRFAITCDYGVASQRIIENGKGILCSDGWENGPQAWDGIPTSVIADVVGEDYFFVPSEWERCIFIIKLIERRLENFSADDIKPLTNVLNEKIYYCHMPPEKLQELEDFYDINGNPYIDSHVLHSALWQAVQLETLITRADNSSHLDNMITSPVPPSLKNKWFKVPSKDETLSGLPKELNSLLNQSLSTTVTNKLNPDDSKTTQGDSIPSKDDILYNWTKIPPFRFSIAFSNVSELTIDKRVYGKTFWYAGSYWNLYLQKSHLSSKNSYQVGVYLHRAHSGISNSSSKSGLINPDIYSNSINYQSIPKKYPRKDNSLLSRHISFESNVPKGNEFTESNNFNESSEIDNLGMHMVDLSISDEQRSTQLPSTSVSKNPSKSKNKESIKKESIINYEDQRNAIKVYFVIFTPSRRSAPTITSFLSVPNDFSRSQSWGWKSNNMCVFNEDGTFAEGQDPNLKFMILLGNV